MVIPYITLRFNESVKGFMEFRKAITVYRRKRKQTKNRKGKRYKGQGPGDTGASFLLSSPSGVLPTAPNPSRNDWWQHLDYYQPRKLPQAWYLGVLSWIMHIGKVACVTDLSLLSLQRSSPYHMALGLHVSHTVSIDNVV